MDSPNGRESEVHTRCGQMQKNAVGFSSERKAATINQGRLRAATLTPALTD